MNASRPRIVQHSFGSLGSGGPIGALGRILQSDLVESFEFRHVQQSMAAGGINLRLIRQMAREMRDFHPDMAHIRGLGNEGFHGVLAARIARVPRILVSVHGSVGDVVAGHGSLRQRIVSGVLEPITLRMATDVAVVCEAALHKAILRRVGHKLVGVVPNGVDIPSISATVRSRTRHALGIASDDVVLIIVARLAHDKGHANMLESLETLPRECRDNTHVLIVGDGPDSQSIAARAEKLEGVRAHMLGRRLDVDSLLAASDAFVLPSLHENMSNALLEAMAAGLPVVSTAVGGTTEVVSHGGGILVPPGDADALSEALEQILTDANLRKELGARARLAVEQNYTTQHMTAALASVYWRVLERQKK